MGNFSINHHSTIRVGTTSTAITTIVDFAEIPTLQFFQEWGLDPNAPEDPAAAESRVRQLAADLVPQLELTAEGVRLPLSLESVSHEIVDGAAGLRTLRLEMRLTAQWHVSEGTLSFRDGSFEDRIGWKEIVIRSGPGIRFPDGNPFETDRSAALTQYPSDPTIGSPATTMARTRVATGTSETSAPLTSVASSGSGGQRVAAGQSALDGILNRRELSVGAILAGLAIAFLLGAFHALSPGHGKTLVAAYLVGNRGTAQHALWLGGIVTFTHTVGVFLLGVVTLFASRYVVPEKLYPWIGLVSGLTIVAVAFNLLRQRLGGLIGHAHDGDAPGHTHDGSDAGHVHGPSGHTHEIPDRITFRSLVALGVSGGIVPCPSALVVLLSAIALHRLEFGLALITAFSAGLATVLVLIGLLVVRAGAMLQRSGRFDRWTAVFPVVSAVVIGVIGLGICAQALGESGLLSSTPMALAPVWAVLGVGLLLGLKHATDADHVVAVTTFVSEEKAWWKSCGIGLFWGLGHTFSLAAAGLMVVLFRITIPEWLEARLEFIVALMLVVLGARVVYLASTGRLEVHRHTHAHSIAEHAHWHVHARAPQSEHQSWSHFGWRPFVVGMVHGAAGSAALMLLVLSTIRSSFEALLYIAVFGIGSCIGMLAISALLAMPLQWAKNRLPVGLRPIQLAAGLFSCLFGVYLGIEIWSAMP